MFPSSILVLQNVTAAAADVTLANGIMTIGNATDGYLPVIPTRNLRSGGANKVAYVAGTANVQTITIPTPAANTEYAVSVWGATQRQFQRFVYPKQATAPTLAQVRTYFVNALTSVGSAIGFTVSGSSPDIILTAANAPYNILRVAVENLTVANTTPGVAALGTPAQILEQYGRVVVGASGFTVYNFNLSKNAIDNHVGVVSPFSADYCLMVNLADADSGAFITALDNLIDGLLADGSAANAEFVSARS